MSPTPINVLVGMYKFLTFSLMGPSTGVTIPLVSSLSNLRNGHVSFHYFYCVFHAQKRGVGGGPDSM